MSLRNRRLVFLTFFGSCLAVGLLLVSLTTNNWLRASVKHATSRNGTGDIYYGLFSGTKVLNVGIGPRTNPVDLISLIRTEPDFMNLWLWLLTALGAGFALFSSAVAALASVLKAASSSASRGTMILLFISNIASAISQILAFVSWIAQFYIHLTHNVLSFEDRKNHWYSYGLAYFGYGFWLIVLSTLIVIGNIIILYVAYKNERHSRKGRIENPSEEKNPAIMLY